MYHLNGSSQVRHTGVESGNDFAKVHLAQGKGMLWRATGGLTS